MQILDIRKGQPEDILREIARECVALRGAQPLTVQFHIKLLSLIKEDIGEGYKSCHDYSLLMV